MVVNSVDSTKSPKGKIKSMLSQGVLRSLVSESLALLQGSFGPFGPKVANTVRKWVPGPSLKDLLMGLFRGAVFRHGWGARKQPIKHPTEMPTSTMAFMGRFPSLMGRFLTLMGRFPDFVLRGRFAS